MALYQMRIEIKPYKPDEFADSVRSLGRSIRKAKDCLQFKVYLDSEQDNSYLLIGEWKTRQAMEKHFQTQEFQVLLGAAKVLGDSFNMKIGKILKNGDFELARKQFMPPKNKGAVN